MLPWTNDPVEAAAIEAKMAEIIREGEVRVVAYQTRHYTTFKQLRERLLSLGGSGE